MAAPINEEVLAEAVCKHHALYNKYCKAFKHENEKANMIHVYKKRKEHFFDEKGSNTDPLLSILILLPLTE